MYCDINNTTLFYDSDGAPRPRARSLDSDKPVLIVLHGGPGADHAHLRPSFAQHLASDAHIIYLDQRNQGNSQRESFDKFSLAQLADDVKVFCDSLGIANPIVVGHSFGGMVAMAYAAKYSGHASKLVLLNTFATQNLPAMLNSFEALGGTTVREHAETFWATPSLATLENYKATAVMYTNRRWPAEAIERNGTAVPHAELCCHFWAHEGKTFDLLPELHRITCPTLIISGDADPVAPPVCAEIIAARIPQHLVSTVALEDCGHMFWYDQPIRGFASIKKFISS